jgi:NAD(P)H-hydrate epimerase
MMENAGRNLANLARHRFLESNPVKKNILVLAGRGGNGGGAMVAARHLQNWGADVTVMLAASRSEFIDVPARQLEILRCLEIPVATLGGDCIEPQKSLTLIVDGLVGYGLKSAPRGRVRDIIQWANSCATPILSLDIPSGVDSTSGEVFDPSVCAQATLTLALPKKGFANREARDMSGEIYLADISVPPEMLLLLGLEIGPIFARNEIVRLRL